MRKKYHSFEKWEAHKNGMYALSTSDEWGKLVSSRELLATPSDLRVAMYRVLKEWKYSVEENMTDRSMNRQAFLGQCACCIEFGTPDYLTKMAWRLLEDNHRIEANRVADEIIQIFDRAYLSNPKTWQKNI